MKYETKLSYPADWTEFQGTLSGDRSIVAFSAPTDADTSASIVFTPVPADYNKLNSFGGKETIRSFLVPSGW
ncbi:hypothetical protein B484DRAFT_459646 [Ochromonadaceae sp. CCMP2298]|nr:hypothetical protein B484DRAFT_459646 [Ochromonadaceae sp. CCMP2298]